jgi:hypothetical protein
MRDLRARLLRARLPFPDGSAATREYHQEQEIGGGVAAGRTNRNGECERSDWPANAAGLSLYLFGPLRASIEVVIGECFTRRKVKALLGYLYLRRDVYISTDELLEALWPEVDDVALASGRLEAKHPSAAAYAGTSHRNTRRLAVHQGAGRFVLYVQALEQTARLYAMIGEYARAVQLLRRAVREEPLRESSSIQLMECLGRRGDHAEAMRVYLRLKALLERTLELELRPEATALFEAMRRDRAIGRTIPPGSLPAV